MDDFSRLLSINGTLTLICCIFCIFLPGGKAAWETISETVGSRVTLQCNNESESTFTQLTWKMNGDVMFTLNSNENLYISEEATNLTLKMSKLQNGLYALIIASAQIYHTGNYTCEVTSTSGVVDQNWSLIIRESTENWDILMIATVSSVCLLIFLIGLAILIRCNKRRRGNSGLSTIAETQQPTGDIYENCLEIHQYNQRHGQLSKPLPSQYHV